MVLAEHIEFNEDILDVKDRANLDLNRFTRKGYIMPGKYTFTVIANNQSIVDLPFTVSTDEQSESGSSVCLTSELIERLGLKPSALKTLIWKDNCLDPSSLPGMVIRVDLSTSSLYLDIPESFLEYSDAGWEPPARWDDGIPAVIFDYDVSAREYRDLKQGYRDKLLNGRGVTGGNLGAWRMRAEWMGQIQDRSSKEGGNRTHRLFKWNQFYAYRAIRSLGARLTVGEDYLSSGIFDSFRFTGANLVTDDNMLPPNLRGYAPEIVGVANTNAKVVVSQQGRVIYESQVAKGPFRVQTLSNSAVGQLDVRVEEQDGSVQKFTVNTSTIPYLTRPGLVRYKLASGRLSDIDHKIQGPLFAAGEFSWGVNNGWSLYGGSILSKGYQAAAIGIGRDLLALGAVSFDATQSLAEFPNQKKRTGGSYRLSYSKRFDELDNQITFAGYRFAQRDYMSMSEYVDARYNGFIQASSKEMYTVTFSQYLRDLGTSAYLSYSHQSYWDRASTERLSFSASKYFDIGSLRFVNASITAYRNKAFGLQDDGIFASLSIPLGNGTVSYNMSGGDRISQDISYANNIDSRNSYQISTGLERDDKRASGYYSYSGDSARFIGNISAQDNNYFSTGMSMQGGVTITPKGADIHRVNSMGGTRLLVDTDVGGVPIQSYGANQRSNIFGKAIITDINSYYRNSVRVDVNNLADDVEASPKSVNLTLTQGSVGYRGIPVVSGKKGLAIIRLVNGSFPPFGASVLNKANQEVGIVMDDGNVYLTGIQSGNDMFVQWDGAVQCQVTFPERLPENNTTYLLPCTVVSRQDAGNAKKSNVKSL